MYKNANQQNTKKRTWSNTLILKKIYLLYVSEFFSHVCLRKMCVFSTWGSHKRASDLLEQDVRMIVNCFRGAGNKTWCVFNHSVISPVPI